MLLILSIVIIHELGHIIVALKQGWDIRKIHFYPYGGQIEFNMGINTKLREEWVIAWSGVLLQSLYYFIVCLIYYHHHLSNHSFQLFRMNHYAILFFNLLPIYPLDGSKIVHILLSRLIPFKKAHLYSVYLSFLFLIYLVLSSSYSINLYILFVLLFIQQIK